MTKMFRLGFSILSSLITIQASPQNFQPDIIEILKSIEVIDQRFLANDQLWKIKQDNVEQIWRRPHDLFEFFKRPHSVETEQAVRSGEIVHEILRNLRAEYAEIRNQTAALETRSRLKRSARIDFLDSFPSDFLDTMFQLAGCKANSQIPDCSDSENACKKYQSISGDCNNLDHPDWGMSNQQLARWLPANYEDNYAQPVGWDPSKTYNGFKLPTVRQVSNAVASISSVESRDSRLSHMSVVYGQYLDHDLDFSPLSQNGLAINDGRRCSEVCENVEPCYPISLDAEDSKVTNSEIRETLRAQRPTSNKPCLPFSRSAPVCGSDSLTKKSAEFVLDDLLTGKFQRQQLNAITNFVDASTVYGSTASQAKRLRAFNGLGQMKVHPVYSDHGLDLLPEKPDVGMCIQSEKRAESGDIVKCFDAGDGRASEHLTLSAIHTIWLREHNRLTKELSILNPHWGEETLFQEARKIVIALHQKVFIDEYYPAILGETAPGFEAYSSVNPTIPHAFATAAFRFGHATIHPLVMRLNENFEEADYGSLLLHTAFFQPWRIVDEGGLDPLLRGLIHAGAKLTESSNIMTDELREKLFKFENKVGFDLASINLQRGRDHGLAFYNDWREFCGLARLVNFSDLELSSHLSESHKSEIYTNLEKTYGSVENIDFWIGALLENLVDSAAVGPTNHCIIKKTFLNLRDGDRFWYENPGVFTQAQNLEINRMSLSKIICQNSGLTEIQPKAMEMGDRVSCDALPDLDLAAWQEKLPAYCDLEKLQQVYDSHLVAYKTCYSNPDKIVFECKRPGYKFQGATFAVCNSNTGLFELEPELVDKPPNCVDINECQEGIHNCNLETHRCVNQEGSFVCELLDDEDGKEYSSEFSSSFLERLRRLLDKPRNLLVSEKFRG